MSNEAKYYNISNLQNFQPKLYKGIIVISHVENVMNFSQISKS